MSTENEVRAAAARLHDAVAKARENGLVVTWPSRPEDLLGIAISETGSAKVAVTVQADLVDPKVATKAADAAQKAADKVIDKATDKP